MQITNKHYTISIESFNMNYRRKQKANDSISSSNF